MNDDELPSIEEVVASIKAMPPNPNNIRPAEGSLASALRELESAPAEDVDHDAWMKQWAAVEAEIRAMNQVDDVAEGRS